MADWFERLAAARSLLSSIRAPWDVGRVLEPEAELAVDTLQSLLTERPADDEAAQARAVLGWLYWFRCIASPPERKAAELLKSGKLLLLVLLEEADPIPEIAPELRAEGSNFLAVIGLDVLREAAAHGGGKPHDSAAAVWRRIVAATPADHPGLAERLRNLGIALGLRYERLGGPPADLDRAIDACRRALAAGPADPELRASILSNLGNLLRARFSLTGSAADVDEALAASREALAVGNDQHPERMGYLSNFSLALWVRYRASGNAEDLSEAIAALSVVLTRTPEGHPNRADYLSNLGHMLIARYKNLGSPDDVDQAIEASYDALAAAPVNHPQRAKLLSGLGNALSKRFETSGAAEDLYKSINKFRAALAALPESHPQRAVVLLSLGSMLFARSESSGSSDDLAESINLFRSALAAAPGEHSERAGILSNLGAALRMRYERTGALLDLEAAIDAGRAALAIVPAGDPRRSMVLSVLGGSLFRRFTLTEEAHSLEEAIDLLQEALTLVPEGNLERGGILTNLGIALRNRFGYTSAASDLNQALDIMRAAVMTLPKNHPQRATALSNLGNGLRAQLERIDAPHDPDAAIEVGRAALAATPHGHPDRAMHLSNLASSLQTRFERTGASANLDEAVEMGRAAVATTPPGDSRRAMRIASLANMLRVRFGSSGASADVDEAVRMHRAALAATPEGTPKIARQLSDLGLTLWTRFERTGVLDGLEEAVDTLREALACPSVDPQVASGINLNLGIALHMRFLRLGAAADLDEAISHERAALAVVAIKDSLKATILSNLSLGLRERFVRFGDPADLDAAVDAGLACVRVTSEDHPNRAMHLNNLGGALQTRFNHSGTERDACEAFNRAEQAAMTRLAPPLVRIGACRSAAAVGARADPRTSAVLLEIAVGLLPELAARHLQRTDHEFGLGLMTGTASDAAALVMADTARPEAERAVRAVRLLEAGRSILLRQAIDTRGDLGMLRDANPELARRYAELCDALDETTPMAATQPNPHAQDDRRALTTEFNAVLREIRILPQFASFARLPEIGDLLADTAEGPVVVLNVSVHRSDALILRQDGVAAVPLPELRREALVDRVNVFHQALMATNDRARSSADRRAAQAALRDILAWLWDTVAEPVLTELGYHHPPVDDEWPRVWWSPGGLLGLLPLHAAGRHEPEHVGQSVIDRVVSSYTPTVRALHHARQQIAAASRNPEPGRSLIVAMPTTPGPDTYPPLPGAAVEAELLAGRLPRAVLLVEPNPDTSDTLSGAVPTRATVLGELPDCAIAHLACHGTHDLANPSLSQLLLHDYPEAPLTVASLSSIRLEKAQIAYLSACRTAFQGGGLLDESIHLTTAFQLAGFPRVIGTLWEIPDSIAVAVSGAFYTHMSREDGRAVDYAQAAHALHHAIRALRDTRSNRNLPSQWAAYLHAGA